MINRPELVDMCGYKLTTNWQNFTKTCLAWVKILQSVLAGYFFDSHYITHNDISSALPLQVPRYPVHAMGSATTVWLNITQLQGLQHGHGVKSKSDQGFNVVLGKRIKVKDDILVNFAAYTNYSLLRHWGSTYTIQWYTVNKTIKQKHHSRKNLTEVHKHQHNLLKPN